MGRLSSTPTTSPFNSRNNRRASLSRTPLPQPLKLLLLGHTGKVPSPLAHIRPAPSGFKNPLTPKAMAKNQCSSHGRYLEPLPNLIELPARGKSLKPSSPPILLIRPDPTGPISEINTRTNTSPIGYKHKERGLTGNMPYCQIYPPMGALHTMTT